MVPVLIQPKPQSVVSPENEQIYTLIKDEPLTLDELVEKTNMEIPRISDILLRLEMQDLITNSYGTYSRSSHA
ncbi:MAG: hypothetical protein NT033_06675 [Candidatus Omnitrophica bacterium]|nr:hypothetical protein [Candidatus Omnitrophota bacterium]